MKVGDTVIRMLAGTVPHKLKITELTDILITCGPWTFDRTTGAEIDEDLNWGPPPLVTGSFIKFKPLKTPKCWCWDCHDGTATHMVLCPDCGNKRCPKANNHNNKCTNSNESGQKGSAYE